MTKFSDEFPPPFTGEGERAEGAVEGACAVERA